MHFHARNTCEINNLVTYSHDTTIQYKFSTDGSRNLRQNVFCSSICQTFLFLALYFDKIAIILNGNFFHVYY
jgi:hypothetical protein